MAFEGLRATIAADASDYVGEASDAASASEDLGAASDETADSLIDIDKAGIAAGGSIAGLGTAMQRTFDSTRDVRAELARVAQQTDLTESSARDLTTSLSDATLSHEEITGAMREFQGLGVSTRREMEQYIEAADTIADATGSSADAIAQRLAPQVRALDGDLSALQERQDAFVLAAEQSSLSIDEIGRNLGQLDFEPLREMGVESDEAALAMAEFADKTGLPPRQLRTEFRNAVEESDGDLREFEEALGLSAGGLAELTDEVDENAGIAEEQADAVGDQASTMDELRASFANARLQASEYLGPLDALGPAMQTAGIAAMALSTVNLTALTPSFAAVSAAAAPVTLPMLAIAAAGALLAGAFVADIGGFRTATVGAFSAVTDVGEHLMDFFTDLPDHLMEAFFRFHPAGIMIDRRDEIIDAITGLPGELASIGTDARDELLDSLPSASDFYDRGVALIEAIVDGIKSVASLPADAIEEVAGSVGSYLPGSDAERGELSTLTDDAAAVPETLASEIEGGERDVASASERTTAGASPTGGGGGGGAGEQVLRLVIEAGSGDLAELVADELTATIEDRGGARTMEITHT